MQLFIDFFPVLAFFVAYKVYDIYVATAVIIVAIALQVLIQWLRTRTVSRMLVASAVLVFLFGGITLLLRDQAFIQWKPTVLNWLFGLVFLGSHYIGGKPIIQRMLEQTVALEDQLWRNLNMMWVGYFTVLGAANLYVVFNFSENAWVNFKLFGMLGLTLVFVILQTLWLSLKMPHDERPQDEDA